VPGLLERRRDAKEKSKQSKRFEFVVPKPIFTVEKVQTTAET
jgi:hypothetical protein